MKHRLIAVLGALLVFSFAAQAADETYKPFILASVNDASLGEQVTATIDALEHAGFRVAGQYAPLENARVIVVTSDELLAVAAQSDRGGYAAGQRISVTERNGRSEVAFVNPMYIQYAYRLNGDMQPILDQLSEALGNQESYGAEKKMTAKKLGKYNYKPMMEKFDDPLELGSFDSHEAAVQAVADGLAAEGDGLTEVYRIAMPGKEQVVFGVGMKAVSDDDDELDIDEAHQLSIVDFDGYSKVAYYPYEILVSGSDVEALHMRFRMAVHFPDLAMMGDHGFMKLRASPGAIEDAFEDMVSGK